MKGRKKNAKGHKDAKIEKKNLEEEEKKLIEQRIREEMPEKGTNPLAETLKKEEKKEGEKSKWLFSTLPLSTKTQQGLEGGKFHRMTAIQKASIPHSLGGRDLLGAAKTGSGKTLAFLVPVLELLWRLGWTKLDGLGALILSPTRELALQTFQVLCTIGAKHDQISGGLVIGGGTDLDTERRCIGNMNILVCTPGRLLQHMDQTPNFDCANLKILVLDEADRMLDMGFNKEINAILENLPRERQTLLFSATQNTSVSQLARLSLKDPEFISVHAQSMFSTPSKLKQYYSTCELDKKINVLWTFLRRNTDKKMLVFFASQKEVRFINESFRLLRPGLPVMHLHGKMPQSKRQKVFQRFQESNCAVLFATDIAARGLDFKGIDWVIQFDCPEDVDTYIHRCGRTARYKGSGSAMLFLVPSEMKMIELLENRKVPIEQSQPDESTLLNITKSLQELLLQNNQIKFLAQKAVRSYLKSVHLMANKEVFNVQSLPCQEYAASMGLMGVPQINFVEVKKIDKNEIKAQENLERLFKQNEKELDESNNNIIPVRPKKVHKSKVEKLLKRKNVTVLSEAAQKLIPLEDDGDDDDDVLVRKTENQTHLMNFDELPIKKKDRGPTLDMVEGEVDQKTGFFEKVKDELEKVDPEDRRAYQKRVSEKKLILKIREKEAEMARKPIITRIATIANPLSSDEEFEGKDNYSDEEDQNEYEEYDDDDEDDNDDEEEEEGEEEKSSVNEKGDERVTNQSRKRRGSFTRSTNKRHKHY